VLVYAFETLQRVLRLDDGSRIFEVGGSRTLGHLSISAHHFEALLLTFRARAPFQCRKPVFFQQMGDVAVMDFGAARLVDRPRGKMSIWASRTGGEAVRSA